MVLPGMLGWTRSQPSGQSSDSGGNTATLPKSTLPPAVAIPTSVRKERIVENLNVFDFQLNPEDVATIATLDSGQSFFDHRDPAFVKLLGTAKRNT